MLILGIETSCDETAASVIETRGEKIRVLSNVVSSQIQLHQKWGGVVPNLAAREHLKNIFPVINTALKEAKTKPEKLDLLAVTRGPGLIPALLIGVNAAKTLAYVWQKPLIGIHHIEGHIYANFIGVNPKLQIPNSNKIKNSKLKIQNSGIKFPILCLVVSGGHTQLVLMKKHLHYQIIGETQDDAVGEAFDKVARILGLGYPGGPSIALQATKFKIQNSKFKINLPRPMINSKDFNFSFSGLKTAVLYETKKHPELLKKSAYIATLCYEFQQAVVDVLIAKTLKAAKKFHPQTILLAGGVSANQELRKQLGIAIRQELENISYVLPNIQYSLDNASMIAAAAFPRQKLFPKKNYSWKKIQADAELKLA